ncbi:cuticle protein 19.8-like [Anabrus simplex]|uniref:cuticle protein 19.8-like n=1 Tax=Anabrus simplex TaxID=316456 RepID=UPI0035A39A60
MKLLFVFSVIVAAAVARPGYLAGGVASIAAAPAVVANAPDAAVIADAISRVAIAAPAPAVVAAAPAVAPAPAVVADAPAVVAAAPAEVAAAAPAVVAAAPAAVAAAAPAVVAAAPVTYTAAVAAPLTITSQYHAQDELGQYAYGYAGGPSAKEEIHTADGITRGGYSHIDANGLVQTTSYVSDPVNGFRVAATNLPVAPRAEDAAALGAPQQVEEEPLVAATRAAHEALKAELAAAAEAAPDDPEPIEVVQVAPAAVKIAAAPVVLTAAGVPIDTPEVAAAKAADVIAHIEAKKAALAL